MAGTQVTADVIKDGSITATKLALGAGGTSWQSTPKTSDFTAVSGEGYFVDTTSSAVTVTLPSSPSVGDSISIVDQGGAAGSNAIVLASANKIQNSTDNKELVISNISINVVYSGAAKGWLTYSAANESASVLTDPVIEIRALLIGGGGGGGSATYVFQGTQASGGGGGAGEFLDKPNIIIEKARNYTVSVGVGGAQNAPGTSTSIIADSGAAVTFDYEVFGGGNGGRHGSLTAATGGSSGGGGRSGSTAGQSVAPTKNEGDLGSRAFTGGDAASGVGGAGGGGGAGAAGSNASGSNGGAGGDGFQSDITSTNTYYAGGGGGGSYYATTGTVGAGGLGGGGSDSAGTVNTGSGGGGRRPGASQYGSLSAFPGGSGILILKYQDTLTLTETTSPNVLTFTTDSSSVAGYKITTITAGTSGTIQFN